MTKVHAIGQSLHLKVSIQVLKKAAAYDSSDMMEFDVLIYRVSDNI